MGKRPCATGADNRFVADGKTAPAVVQGRRFFPAERQVKAVKDFLEFRDTIFCRLCLSRQNLRSMLDCAEVEGLVC